jgi:hypothetical protein
MNQHRRGVIALSLAIFMTTQLSAAPVIGVASTRGTMEVNSSPVRGTANVSEGCSIRTNETVGQIDLRNGVQLTLGQNTAASVYSNRVELREGGGQVTTKQDYGVEALGFRVAPAGRNALARVMYDRNRILVTAIDSPLKVSKDGVLLARVNAGATYYFEQEPTTDGSAASAGRTNGNPNKPSTGAQSAVKAGLSSGVKWGIATGAAAAVGTGIGLGVALSGSNASR